MLGAGWSQVEAQDSLIQDRSRSQAYKYVAEGRRDPFRSIIKPNIVPWVQEPAVHPPSLPKVHWSLLGIMSGVTGPHAMLQHTNGSRYFVSLGDILPDENIRVIGLTRTIVTLEWLEQNGGRVQNGRDQPQTMELTFTSGK